MKVLSFLVLFVLAINACDYSAKISDYTSPTDSSSPVNYGHANKQNDGVLTLVEQFGVDQSLANACLSVCAAGNGASCVLTSDSSEMKKTKDPSYDCAATCMSGAQNLNIFSLVQIIEWLQNMAQANSLDDTEMCCSNKWKNLPLKAKEWLKGQIKMAVALIPSEKQQEYLEKLAEFSFNGGGNSACVAIFSERIQAINEEIKNASKSSISPNLPASGDKG